MATPEERRAALAAAVVVLALTVGLPLLAVRAERRTTK